LQFLQFFIIYQISGTLNHICLIDLVGISKR
jgi:hypothetical protein